MNDILTTGIEIKQRIISEIQNAKHSIYLAMAWFTDRDIANALIEAKNRNLVIDIILSSNIQNETVKKMFREANISLHAFETGDERGMMHHKFCLIDNNISINGSYNYSYNASNNNVENIHVSNDLNIYKQFYSEFERLKYNIDHQIDVNDLNTKTQDTINKNIYPLLPDKAKSDGELSLHEVSNDKNNAKEHAILEFTKVLDSMIAAEIGNFDRTLLRKQGYERSKFNNGDHQVLTKALDTVYSVFINDIDVVDDKKKRLLTKIDEQEVKSINSLGENLSLQLDTLQIASENDILNSKSKIISLKSDSEKNDQKSKELKNIKIVYHEKLINEIKDKIRLAQREFIQPKFKWYEFIPVIFANICLTVYLFIFYSSACYILLFAVEDSKEARNLGLDAMPMEIFNPKALSLTIEKGGSGILFIFLFVSIPIFCALIKLFTKKQWIIITMFIVGIFLIDTAIAYKVSSALYQMKYDSGETNEIWKIKMAFTDPNFYLVFLLGAFGLIMLKFAFEKLMNIFEERNPDIATLKNDLLISQHYEDIQIQDEKIILIQNDIHLLENTNISIDAQIKITETVLNSLPNKLNQLKEINKKDLVTGTQHIQDIATIYKSHIENDNLPISVDSLRDRINIFLEGWNDYLHEQYSIAIATTKSREAFDTTVEWQKEKIITTQIDHRIKL
ncbi:phospholipase D-like domain-containing protein [Pedobacter aquatilis]|uniref:phospholipase D-like domain-containing protein n=1 Tax=Pedobacter aquatilis TaxID=351343 RepID=UPI00292DFF52|nr:phospholipase D-like domain-containing protein [Pedobacter aquatilis]